MSIKKYLTNILSKAFVNLGYSDEYGSVTISNRPDLCQFQCNGALSAAKVYKKSPLIIAGEVATALKEDRHFSLIEGVAPGFININLSDSFITEYVNEMNNDKRLMLPVMEKKTIVIDYGGANIAKPLHVGHLRSAIIGDSLRRLAVLMGHNVIGDVHLGDWGLQMGLVIAQMKKETPDLIYFDESYLGEYPKESPVTIDDLNEIYPKASALSKEDKAFLDEASDITYQLHEGHRGYRALWEHIHRISVEDLKNNYGTLNVYFDEWLGESDAAPYIHRVIETLKKKNLLKESEGAMIVEVERPDDKEPMPPMLILKSNGAEIYGTTDLGTLVQRTEDWNPDEVWYVTDNRQALHFKQVFRCAKMSGMVKEDTQLLHIAFGTMNGKDGKPYKTRAGGVMRLSDLISTVTENAYAKVKESQIVTDQAEMQKVAEMVGICAMKIGDMLNHRTKDYIFDMERFLSNEGKTGPYLQYAYVRIKSILQKARDGGYEFGEITEPASPAERELMLTLISTADSLLYAYDEKAPNIICNVLFDITGVFNRLYAEQKILAEGSKRSSLLSLLDLTGKMLEILLNLLGVEAPENM